MRQLKINIKMVGLSPNTTVVLLNVHDINSIDKGKYFVSKKYTSVCKIFPSNMRAHTN